MIARRISVTVAVAMLLLWVLGSCKKEAEVTAPPPLQISGAGATFPAPIYKCWIEHYGKAHKQVSVAYDPVGSGDGIKKFMNLGVDFGASDAAMNDEQMAEVKRGVKLIPGAAGIVVLAYNVKGLNGSLRLSRAVYCKPASPCPFARPSL